MSKSYITIALISIALFSTQAHAASVCTDTLVPDMLLSNIQNEEDCVARFEHKTRQRGVVGNVFRRQVTYEFGSNVVVARCVKNGLFFTTVLFGYHRRDGRACDIINRVKNAFTD